MTDFSETARAEVHSRYPVWRDSGVGIAQAQQYRSGFVAGAEWADERSRAALDWAMAGWARTTKELAARSLSQKESAEMRQPMTDALRERLIEQVADIIDGALIHAWPNGQSIVRDPSAAAREVLDAISASGGVRVAASADDDEEFEEPYIEMSHTNLHGEARRFQEELPAPGRLREDPIDWAQAKSDLIAHEGQWGLIAENVASSTPGQLRDGKYRHFQGEVLEHFEFAARKPALPEVQYAPRRTDLWGRYSVKVAGHSS